MSPTRPGSSRHANGAFTGTANPTRPPSEYARHGFATACCGAALVALLTAAVLGLAQAADPAIRVLILYAHDREAPGIAEFVEPLRSTIRQAAHPELVEFYDEPLDFDRFPDPQIAKELAAHLEAKYAELRLDAIVAEGSPALQFAVERLEPLRHGVPIVYGLALEPIVDFGALPANVTGRREPLPFASTFAMARKLQPEARRVVIVGGGASPLDAVMLKAAVDDVTPLLGGLALTVLDDWTYPELLDALRRLQPETIVLVSFFRRDRSGAHLSPGVLMPSLTRASAAPVYGIISSWVGQGIVGGDVVNVTESGARTGELVVQTIRRAPGEPLTPREVGSTERVVDWRELRRRDLSEAHLPPDTEVLFRPATLWERYKSVILPGVGALAAQSLLIALLLLERRRRVRAQRAVAEQAAHEQLIAELTADTARHATESARPALADALARIARFAGASAAVLEVVGETESDAPLRSFWSDSTGQDRGADAPFRPGGARIDIPLLDNETPVGRLELYREVEWSSDIAARLRGAADLFAAGLSRAREARALEDARSQLAYVARVATVGELAAALSHQLRQPLTAIRVQAEAGMRLLTRTPPDLTEVHGALEDIVEEDARAAGVIENVQRLLRRQETKRAAISLNEVCRDVVQLLAADAVRRDVALELALDPHVPPFDGDAVELQQAVVNLALNALDAVTEQAAANRQVVVGTVARGAEVEIFVRDRGPGLSPEMLDLLFTPFFSTKSRGLGVGLSIVRSIVERHHGSVHGGNDAAGGATFRIILPIA